MNKKMKMALLGMVCVLGFVIMAGCTTATTTTSDTTAATTSTTATTTTSTTTTTATSSTTTTLVFDISGTVTCTVEAAEGKSVVVSVATDMDSDPVSLAQGTIESDTYAYTIQNVPAGGYVVFSIVYFNGGDISEPQSGDYMGLYGVEIGTDLQQLKAEIELVTVEAVDLTGIDFDVWIDYALLAE